MGRKEASEEQRSRAESAKKGPILCSCCSYVILNKTRKQRHATLPLNMSGNLVLYGVTRNY